MSYILHFMINEFYIGRIIVSYGNYHKSVSCQRKPITLLHIFAMNIPFRCHFRFAPELPTP